jgi:ABC-type amino acid transport system permease subunit
MSLIWICFNMLGFTLLIAAVSFCFGLIFQTVLPICPFSPTSRLASCSHACL